MRNSIILVGFMGCGKSSIARKLALKLTMQVMDSDIEIESITGKTIPQIFEEKGESYFRQLETEFIDNQSLKNLVMATGGGMPCFNNNMEKLLLKGTVVYLKTSPKEIYRRLIRSRTKRPLLSKFSNEKDLLYYIEDTLLKREEFYSKANITVVADDVNKEVIVERIIKSLSQSNI